MFVLRLVHGTRSTYKSPPLSRRPRLPYTPAHLHEASSRLRHTPDIHLDINNKHVLCGTTGSCKTFLSSAKSPTFISAAADIRSIRASVECFSFLLSVRKSCTFPSTPSCSIATTTTSGKLYSHTRKK